MLFIKTLRLPFLNLSIAAALAMALVSGPANATVIINVTEAGGDVVFSITGSLDLTGTKSTSGYPNYGLGFIPGGSNWYVASGNGTAVDSYELTSFAGPFGTSTTFFTPPTSTSGDNFFIWGQGGATEQFAVPVGYSGGAIVSGMVFSGATIAGFTMIPGTYNYTLPNDTITLNIGQAVPEPASLALLGLALAGLGFSRRKKV